MSSAAWHDFASPSRGSDLDQPTILACEQLSKVYRMGDVDVHALAGVDFSLRDEQRVNVIVALTDPRSSFPELADGYRVEARIVLWEGSRVLKAPLGSVFRHGDGWAAFRLIDGRARLTPLRLGHRSETEVEVTSGLERGARLALHPSDAVVDDVRVEAR